MRKYTFEVILHEGSDEFWESEPSDKEVRLMLIDAIESIGFNIKGQGYEFAIDEVNLKRFEDE